MGFFEKLLGGKTKDYKTRRKEEVEMPEPEDQPAAPVEPVVRSEATPFRVSMGFTPFRLSAMKDNSVDLVLKITNLAAEKQLVSVSVLLPRKELIGFEPTVINKGIEKKIGAMEAGETKEVSIRIWGTNQTRANNYPFEVAVYAHYIDYDKVISYIKKRGILRVV